jgi:hypothetical protein
MDDSHIPEKVMGGCSGERLLVDWRDAVGMLQILYWKAAACNRRGWRQKTRDCPTSFLAVPAIFLMVFFVCKIFLW